MIKDNLMTTQEIAQYLKLNEKTIIKLAKNGEIPGIKIANQWRFSISAIDEYLHDKMLQNSTDENELTRFIDSPESIPLSRFIEPNYINLHLSSTDKDSVLLELARFAETAEITTTAQNVYWHLQKREQLLSTSLGNGIAIPHPRNPSDELFKKPAVIIGRSLHGIAFQNGIRDTINVFFVICAPDVVLHLLFLSQVAKLIRDGSIYTKIMNAETNNTVIAALLEYEKNHYLQ